MDSRPGINLAQETHKTSFLGERTPGTSGGHLILFSAPTPRSKQPPPNYSSFMAISLLRSFSFCECISWSSFSSTQYASAWALTVWEDLLQSQLQWKEPHLGVSRPQSRDQNLGFSCFPWAEMSHSILESGAIKTTETVVPLILHLGTPSPRDSDLLNISEAEPKLRLRPGLLYSHPANLSQIPSSVPMPH